MSLLLHSQAARTHIWVPWSSRAPWDRGHTLSAWTSAFDPVAYGLDLVASTELQEAATFMYGTKWSVDRPEQVWACHLMALTAFRLCALWHPSLCIPQPGGKFLDLREEEKNWVLFTVILRF